MSGADPLSVLHSTPGPVVVAAKGHSGTRFLARSLQVAGVFMGADLNPMTDSLSWHRRFGVPLMNSQWFPNWPTPGADAAFDEFVRERLADTAAHFGSPAATDVRWGWKGSTLFVTEVLEHHFPELTLIHLIRDGRDVALSEDGLLNLPGYFPVKRRDPRALASRLKQKYLERDERDRYRLRVFLGTSELEEWNGVRLDDESIRANRYLFQMNSWMRNVTAARSFGDRHPDRYLELRYEELCTEPAATIDKVVAHLGLTSSPQLEAFVTREARVTSIRKWEQGQMAPDRRADFDRACEHGRPLLDELGYVD